MSPVPRQRPFVGESPPFVGNERRPARRAVAVGGTELALAASTGTESWVVALLIGGGVGVGVGLLTLMWHRRRRRPPATTWAPPPPASEPAQAPPPATPPPPLPSDAGDAASQAELAETAETAATERARGPICQVRWTPLRGGSQFVAVTIDAAGVERTIATSPRFDWRGPSPPEQSAEAQAALRRLSKQLRDAGWRGTRGKGTDFDEQQWYARRFLPAEEPAVDDGPPVAAE